METTLLDAIEKEGIIACNVREKESGKPDKSQCIVEEEVTSSVLCGPPLDIMTSCIVWAGNQRVSCCMPS